MEHRAVNVKWGLGGCGAGRKEAATGGRSVVLSPLRGKGAVRCAPGQLPDRSRLFNSSQSIRS